MTIKFISNLTTHSPSSKNTVALLVSLILLSIFFGFIGCASEIKTHPTSETSNEVSAYSEYPNKLNWFIPDGLRADPDIFTIFKWAKEGKLPNIKRMMDEGSYGYSIPTFPSHTPTNFAALLTGTYPITNGVADGPMRVEGQTLQKPAIGGFSSMVLDYIHNKRKKNTLSVVKNLVFPDMFIDHNSPENQYKEIGMDAESIEKNILSIIAPKDINLKVIENI